VDFITRKPGGRIKDMSGVIAAAMGMDIESWNHRIAWVGRGLKDHEAPPPLQPAGLLPFMFNTRPGCPGPHPTWP